MTMTRKNKTKTMIAAALIAVAGLIGIGVSDAHAGGKHSDKDWNGRNNGYTAHHVPPRHHPKPNVTYREGRSSDRLGTAIAELFVYAVTGDVRPYQGNNYDAEYVSPPRHWKHGKHRWKANKHNARGRSGYGRHIAKTCYPVRKVVQGPYGNRRVVHGTACRDAYGNVQVVPGSRHVVRHYR